MGAKTDMKDRTKKARKYLPDNVENARRAIYQLGMPIGGAAVEGLLRETSSVPTSVSYPFSLQSLSQIMTFWHFLECFC